MKNPLLSYPDLVTKKNLCSYADIFSKNVNSLKNAFIPIFCQKYVHSLKTHCSHVIFQFFHEKPPAVMPIFGQKCQFC